MLMDHIDAAPAPAPAPSTRPHQHPDRAPGEELDRLAQAALARMFSGLSPISLTLAYTDWALHMATSPGSQARLTEKAQENLTQWFIHQSLSLLPASHPARQLGPLEPMLAEDPRFSDPSWNDFPWAALPAAAKLTEAWWHEACSLRGMSDHSREQMRFHTRQLLDMLSPSNWAHSNPEVIRQAIHTAGGSLIQGMQHAVDAARVQHGLDPVFGAPVGLRPGAGLAMTPGEVVMRNHLVELIQYAPVTPKAKKEPVLIVPSCILKYYILDLSPHNSLVSWLVSEGHTVFMLSWRNPDENDALLGLDDYIETGVLAALDHVRRELGQPVHLAGYCLGGTFASIAAAVLQQGIVKLAGTGNALASLTLLAAETDFREPGELGVLIDDAQVEALEATMAEKGYLTGKQMAGSFQYLHSRELIWSNRTRTLLLGEPAYTNDLMAWNADLTRLPAVMHSQYLRRMYLANELAEGRYAYAGQILSLADISVPLFVVGTEKDHVSPWRSVFKIHRLVSGEVTFVLTSGGHNAGIISEPGHKGRHFQMQTTQPGQARPSPEDWQASASRHEGSWWLEWHQWLAATGSGKEVAAPVPRRNTVLGSAPGEYVLVRYAD